METYPFRDPTLPLEERLADLMKRLTIEEKLALLPTQQAAIERLGIPEYHIGAEGAHGFVDREGVSTTFPQTIGLACSWDRRLFREIGKVIGEEARAYFKKSGKGGLSLWFPTIDMERHPRWGRTEEGYGEDPYLTGELAAEIIRGAQGEDPFYLQVSCAPKHFFANNNEKNRGSCSCSVDPRNLYEYYLPAFKTAFLKGGAYSLMTAYNEVNGIPMMIHPLVRDLVKNTWGLEGKGHVVTDGADVRCTVLLHHYFEKHADTIAAALKNGVDTMTDDPALVIPAAREALQQGLMSEAELDRAVAASLRVRFRFGHFDPPGICPYDQPVEEGPESPRKRNLARRAVQESVVLLKNVLPLQESRQPLLPLDLVSPIPSGKRAKIALIGPLIDQVYGDWYSGNPPYRVSVVDALRSLVESQHGKEGFIYEQALDEVCFTTMDGRPLVIDGDGNLRIGKGKSPVESSFEGPAFGTVGLEMGVSAAATPCAESSLPEQVFAGIDDSASLFGKVSPELSAAVFVREDWGWGANTLYNPERQRYLETKEFFDVSRQPAEGEALLDERGPSGSSSLKANASTTLNWFITTLYNLIPTNISLMRGKTGTTEPTKRSPSQPETLVVEEHGRLEQIERTGRKSPSSQGWEAGSISDTPFVEKNYTLYRQGPVFLRTWNSKTLRIDKEGNFHLERFCSEPTPLMMHLLRDGIEKAVEAAKGAETVILCLGNNPVINGKEEVDRPSLRLPPYQSALLKAVLAANPRTVVVLMASYPFTLDEEERAAPAIVYLAHGLQELGNGLVDVLVGRVSPAGRLPLTWYEREKDLPDIMEYDIIRSGLTYQYTRQPVLFPFGHGLSYSRFTYKDLRCSSPRLAPGEEVSIHCTVVNEGPLPADEVVQFYVAFYGSKAPRPLRSLKGFERLHLRVGEARPVEFRLRSEDLAIWDVRQGRFWVESGRATLMIGASSEDIRLSTDIEIQGECLLPRSPDHIEAWNYDAYQWCYLHEKRGESVPAVFGVAKRQEKLHGGEAYGTFEGGTAQNGRIPAREQKMWPSVGAKSDKNGGIQKSFESVPWVLYREIDFEGGKTVIEVTTAAGPGTTLELYLDSLEGPPHAVLPLPTTTDICAIPDAPQRPDLVWATLAFPIAPIEGIHDLYLVFRGNLALHRFRFGPTASASVAT
ncbi:MAG TPA: glycoside hydrolase family 3 C-terminal domain-containing protein [Termitinemataceae bacterium]|nr:glycoside hydrolase family 3 C-terminal domain-containing protein [Termitinemataceae bacterium]